MGAHHAASPQHFRWSHTGPVSGLASLAAPPSRTEVQWRYGAAALAYRCGGSSGFATGVAHRFPVSPSQGFLSTAPEVKRPVIDGARELYGRPAVSGEGGAGQECNKVHTKAALNP